MYLTLRQRPTDKRLYQLIVSMGDVTDETRNEWLEYVSDPSNPNVSMPFQRRPPKRH